LKLDNLDKVSPLTQSRIEQYMRNANEDEQMALKITMDHWPWEGGGGMLAVNIAKAVAEGIAEGRKKVRDAK
jgi:hypothetical protein